MATRLGTLARIKVRAAAPLIVEEAGRHAGRLTGGAPRRALAADGDAVAVEDPRADAALVGGSSIAKRPFTSCVAPRSDRACLASGTSLGRSWRHPGGIGRPASALFAQRGCVGGWRPTSWPDGSVGPDACPCSAASARPVATCATIAGQPVTMGLDAIGGAQAGGVRRPPSPQAVGKLVPKGARRALLRGGASHEAKGRRGARGGRSGDRRVR